VVAAIVKQGPNYSAIADLLRRRRNGVHRYIEGNVELKEFFDEQWDRALDHIENQQRDAAKLGDLKTGHFLLKTKGRKRGYGTMSEAPTPPPVAPEALAMSFEVREARTDVKITRGARAE